MTRKRDLKNLRQREKYKPHQNAGCQCEECQLMDLWLDRVITELEQDCS